MATTKKKIVSVKAKTNLASIEDRLAARVNKASAHLESDGSNIIRMGRDGFKWQGAESMDMNVIVLGSIFENVYYDVPYDASNSEIVHPLCWGLGKYQADVNPPEELTTKISDSCTGCEYNEFGSRGKGKACQNRRRIAMVAVPYGEDGELDFAKVNPTEVGILRVPPTSLAPFSKWENSLYMGLGRDPITAVAFFSIDEAATYGKLNTPETVAAVPNDLVDKLLDIDADALLMDVTHIMDPTPYTPPRGRPPPKSRSRLSK